MSVRCSGPFPFLFGASELVLVERGAGNTNLRSHFLSRGIPSIEGQDREIRSGTIHVFSVLRLAMVFHIVPHMVFLTRILVPALFLSTSAFAESFLHAEDCPQVFGTQAHRSDNQRERATSLSSFSADDKGWRIVHTVPGWERPARLRFNGVQFESLAEIEFEVPTEAPKEPEASEADPASEGEEPPLVLPVRIEKEDAMVVRLEDDLASMCPSGPYLVRIDDAIGRSARVIGLTNEGALIELDGELRAIPLDGSRLPQRIRMMWKSAYDIMISSAATGSSSRSAKESRAKRKTSKAKKAATPKKSTRRRRKK